MKISQDFEYQGDDWWKWWIWVEGTDAELDEINHVVYTLHSTFPDPVRTVEDRSTKFRLETAGWGTFRIYATAFLKSGSPVSLSHHLVLRYPDGSETAA